MEKDFERLERITYNGHIVWKKSFAMGLSKFKISYIKTLTNLWEKSLGDLMQMVLDSSKFFLNERGSRNAN